MVSVVVLAILHPGGGGPVPVAHHLVAARRDAVAPSGLDVVEQHARQLPMNTDLPECGALTVGKAHSEAVGTRRGGRADRLTSCTQEHANVRLEESAPTQDVVVVAAPLRIVDALREVAQVGVQLVNRVVFETIPLFRGRHRAYVHVACHRAYVYEPPAAHASTRSRCI